VVNARGRPARSRTHGIPSMRCTATAKWTGERCKNHAVVGSTVCNLLGVNGATIRKAEERITIAQLRDRDPRHPMEIVLDMTSKLDVITQAYQDELLADVESITDDQVDRLVQLSTTTHHLASTAISTKAAEKVALAFEQHLELQGRAVGVAIGAALDRLGLTEPWRIYALNVARRALLGDEAQGDEPQPPEDPVVQEYDVRPRGTAPAIAAGPTASVPCDVAGLDDEALRSLGEAVLDELTRREIA
jgi:hypothetical protein